MPEDNAKDRPRRSGPKPVLRVSHEFSDDQHALAAAFQCLLDLADEYEASGSLPPRTTAFAHTPEST